MNKKLILLSSFLFLSACDSKNDIEKMDAKTAEQQFICKDCVNVKIKINDDNYSCLNSANISFPLYLKPLIRKIDISGFVINSNDKKLIQAVYYEGNSIFSSYLMGKWGQDDIDGYGSANIYYIPDNDYVTLSVKKSIVENNRESYVAEDINGAISSFCENYNDYMKVYTDKNNWTYSNDLDNKK